MCYYVAIMARHDTSLPILAPGPIDIAAAAAVLERGRFVPSDTPDFEPDAYADLGGHSLVPYDERQAYLPYANVLAADPRKRDIAHGLGHLGLLVVQPEDVERFRDARQLDFVAAAVTYENRLDKKSQLLLTPGQIEGMQHIYPETDQTWAKNYAEELSGLHAVFTASEVFASVKKVRDQNREAVYKRVHTVPQPNITVEIDKHGKPVVVNATKRPAHVLHKV